MPITLHILGSGSTGNCALLRTSETRVLIDAGFSNRKLQKLLRQTGETPDTIDAIFITHEHSDHVAGIDGFKKNPRVKIFSNAATARQVQNTLTHRPSWQFFDTGSRFRFRDLEIETYSVPHDASDPVGYTFNITRQAAAENAPVADTTFRIAWLPDMGHAPAHIRERIRDVDVLTIEANHCPRLLESDPRRPWSLKQRIAGRHGHLSNESACELLSNIASPRWRHIFLTHLSRDCNTHEAIERNLAPLRARLNCRFTITTPDAIPPIEF